MQLAACADGRASRSASPHPRPSSKQSSQELSGISQDLQKSSPGSAAFVSPSYQGPALRTYRASPNPRPQSSRFVGDLNPEGMFIEAAERVSSSQGPQNGNVGIWLSSVASNAFGQHSQFITSRPPPMMDHFLAPFVREHCLSRLPGPGDFSKLRATYFQKIHPFFPIVHEEDLDACPQNPCSIVIRQLVSLAAGTDPAMARHLRLGDGRGDLLTPQDFSYSLSSALRAILETSMITDRVVHIRALIVLSLYAQPTCTEEADLPPQLGGRAIHHIQTLGLHQLRYDTPNSEDLNTLFCAAWALDRINAALHGRPCIIHERDIGANLGTCIRTQAPCFRLLLFVVQWLDQVIELYRPGPSAEVSGLEKVAYVDLPVLEAMIVDADALKVPSSLIGQWPHFRCPIYLVAA